MGKGELEVGGEQLLNVGAANILGLLNLNDTEDLNRMKEIRQNSERRGKYTYVDRPEAGTVTGSHVLVHALDSIGAGELTVLLVHVVGTGSRVVSEPDTKVLDFQRLLLVDLE